MALTTENEAYTDLLCSHLHAMVWRLRKLPADKWDWTPDPAAPTARILATHTWQWLICDRHHIQEPDALLHPVVPEAPTDVSEMCDELAAEAGRWEELLKSLTTDQLNEPRMQFNNWDMGTVRDFVCHMIQNSIYKHGQFSTLFFALGLDGTDPYDAPFPNPIYESIRGK